MTNETVNTNPVNVLVQSFQASMPETVKKQREFEVLGYRVVYEQIAEAYFVGQRIRRELKADLDNALSERSISVSTKSGANPYLPIVKMLFGKWKTVDGSQKWTAEQDGVEKTLFEPNRSAEKYACVFRYLNKRQDEFPNVTSIIEHIETTTLRAIEEADRRDHTTTSTGTVSNTDSLTRGLSVLSAKAIGTREELKGVFADLPDNVVQGQFWFKTAQDGTIYLMGFRPLEEKTMTDLAKKRGKKLLEERAKQAQQEELARIAA